MKKFFIGLMKNILLQILSLTIITGMIAFAAISFPSSAPIGETPGGKFATILNTILQSGNYATDTTGKVKRATNADNATTLNGVSLSGLGNASNNFGRTYRHFGPRIADGEILVGRSHYADSAQNASSVPWSGITGKPTITDTHSFGGLYMMGTGGSSTACRYANPFTGGCSCPIGYTAYAFWEWNTIGYYEGSAPYMYQCVK